MLPETIIVFTDDPRKAAAYLDDHKTVYVFNKKTRDLEEMLRPLYQAPKKSSDDPNSFVLLRRDLVLLLMSISDSESPFAIVNFEKDYVSDYGIIDKDSVSKETAAILTDVLMHRAFYTTALDTLRLEARLIKVGTKSTKPIPLSHQLTDAHSKCKSIEAILSKHYDALHVWWDEVI
jgi:hypothetical protein